MCIAMAAGTSFRNAWGGPYLAGVFGLEAGPRGLALAVLSLGAFSAAFALPWLLRRCSIRDTVLGWAGATLAAGLALAAWPSAGLLPDVALLTMLATVGVLHPLVMTHGRLLLAPAVRGRGLGLLNSFVFLGSALTSWVFGLIADAGQRANTVAPAVYAYIFVFAALLVVVGLVAYVFSPALPSTESESRSS